MILVRKSSKLSNLDLGFCLIFEIFALNSTYIGDRSHAACSALMSLPGHAVAKPLLRANSEACSKMSPKNSQRCAKSCRTRLAKGARKVAEVPLVRLRRHNLHITAAVEGSPACWGARAPLILVAALTSLRLTCSDLSLKLLYSVESCRTRPAKGACKVAEVPIERHTGQRTAGDNNATSFGFEMQVLQEFHRRLSLWPFNWANLRSSL